MKHVHDNPKILHEMAPTGFYAYEADPATSERITKAVTELNAGGLVSITTWEALRVSGKIVINTVCKAIRESAIFCADITSLNHNVMFELGYAIAQNKRIWISYDPTIPELAAKFDQLKVLTTTGYSKCTNSYEIVRSFLTDKPFEDLKATIFDEAIAPTLPSEQRETLLYLKSRHNTEASVVLSTRVEKAARGTGLPLIIDDPRETTAQPLAWYGEQVYNAAGAICHFVSPKREGASLHNARYALVAGLTHGMGRSLLMLAEGDFVVPIDYRDLLKQYQTASEVEKQFDAWIGPVLQKVRQRGLTDKSYIASLEMAKRLNSLRIGEAIAENEADQLRDEYFVETTAYREALDGRHAIFIGRKGAGKSANLIKLAAAFSADRRKIVCVIKPIAYEFHGIVEVLRRCRTADIKTYAIESLWKFLLYSEIANAAVVSIQNRPSGEIHKDEQDLMAIMQQHGEFMTPDFAIRLERCVQMLLKVNIEQHEGVEVRRVAISEILHEGILKKLRAALSKALAAKSCVAILIDNLDKAWDKQGDIPALTEFLLGLLKACNRMASDFRDVSKTGKSINISLAVFIRSDIFYRVASIARERDKIPFSKISWNDPEQLLLVVEERLVSASGDPSIPRGALWERFFTPEVNSTDTRAYLLSRIIQRPRDLLFFVKAALTKAINRKHSKVEAQDILDAEHQYSQFAVDSILVENGISVQDLEAVIYEFAGSNSVLSREEVLSSLAKARVPRGDRGSVISHLVNLTFLGIETSQNVFRFAEDEQDTRINSVLSEKLAEQLGRSPRYKINPAFCSFLQVRE